VSWLMKILGIQPSRRRTDRLSVFPSRVTNPRPTIIRIVRSQFDVGRTGSPSFRAGQPVRPTIWLRQRDAGAPMNSIRKQEEART
jgi:hypothetical protein